ncbi:MAG: hypothetical protein JWO30_663 [Fibrobacteres bacterium]|nr:hypothetical protein [Fibrobacterota bacterium]
MALKAGTSKAALQRGWACLAAFLAFVLLLSGQGCGTRVAGTEVQDPYELAGRVQLENGDPAGGAVVIAAYAANDGNASGKIQAVHSVHADTRFDTVFADANGRYHFDSLPGEGPFDFTFEEAFASEGDKKLSRLPGIFRTKQAITTLRPVRLKPPVLLIGKVMEESSGELLDSARCEVAGTPYRSISDHGIFHFSLADTSSPGATGFYSITCSLEPYTPGSVFTEVTSNANKLVQVYLNQGATEVVQPAPANVDASYDAATGVVTLSWPKTDFSQFYVYGIRRVDLVAAGGPTVFYTNDTLYRDVVYTEQSDTVSVKHLRYTVYCLKKDLNFATASPATILTATRPTSHGADISLGFSDAQNPFKVGDTAKVVGTFRNVFRDNKSLHWKIKGATDTLRQADLVGTSGADTLAFPCTEPGKIEIGLSVTDMAGIVTTLYKSLEVIAAP